MLFEEEGEEVRVLLEEKRGLSTMSITSAKLLKITVWFFVTTACFAMCLTVLNECAPVHVEGTFVEGTKRGNDCVCISQNRHVNGCVRETLHSHACHIGRLSGIVRIVWELFLRNIGAIMRNMMCFLSFGSSSSSFASSVNWGFGGGCCGGHFGVLKSTISPVATG